MLALITAGEAAFFLPFVLARVFRPTLLDVFGLTNLQLGIAFSVYGTVAMLAYFFGGPLADRISAKKLMACALLATALGGVAMMGQPSLSTLQLLYGYWGVTTILLFWAPLIRATRDWGAGRLPGRAFGFLDGGRGLIAAVIGSGAVTMFALLMPENAENATTEEQAAAFQQVIWLFSAVTGAAAVLVWFVLPRDMDSSDTTLNIRPTNSMKRVLRMPTVWLQAVVVLCAYVGYKGLDDISLYAHDVHGLDEVRAAAMATIAMWVRPFAAVAAGLLGDRYGVTRLTIVCLLLLAVGSACLAAGTLHPGATVLFVATLIATSTAVFALRGLYYAIMDDARVPFGSTGAAVGIVSFVGYTPDIFMGPLMGALLDGWPGPSGHQYVFVVLTGFAGVGLAAALMFRHMVTRRQRL